MACGGKKSSLPPNGTVVQIAPRAKRTPQIDRPKPEKQPRKLIDYHCEECGYVGTHPQHACTPKPVAWMETRQAICKRCPYASDDVCMLYKSMHPDRDCVISIGVEMPFAACPAGLWPRVEFHCPECESISFDAKGVHKCKSCGYRPPRKVSLPQMVKLKPEEPLPAQKPFAIFTLAVGQNSLNQHAITGPQMAAYAEKVGADFHAITDDQYPQYALANKFRLKSLAANYERVLFLDADVWVRSTAPNIFEQFSANRAWMHADRSHQVNRDSLIINYVTIARQQHVSPIIDYRCFNSGVVLFSKEHIDLWTAPPLPAPTQFLTEQIWVEYMANESSIPVGCLPTEFNTQWWFQDFAAREPQAHFIHLAACPPEERLYRLRKLAYAERSLA